MLLAKEVAHTTDVDGMLAGMTPQQFDEWVIIWKIWHPPGDEEANPGDPVKALDAMRKLTGV